MLYIQNTKFSTDVDEVFISSLGKSCFFLGKMSFATGTAFCLSGETLACIGFQGISPMGKRLLLAARFIPVSCKKERKIGFFIGKNMPGKVPPKGKLAFPEGDFQ